MGAGSWNTVSEELAICAEIRHIAEASGRGVNAKDSDRLAVSELLQQWLDETRTQASEIGMEQLHQRVRDQEICVFFRNNHFSTLYKKDGQLHALLTDIAFDGVDDAVWETIELNGASILVCNFRGRNTPAQTVDSKTDVDENVLQEVMALGFSREQAVAAMKATKAKNAEAAILYLLNEQEGGDAEE